LQAAFQAAAALAQTRGFCKQHFKHFKQQQHWLKHQAARAPTNRLLQAAFQTSSSSSTGSNIKQPR
jgi:hypothetical protein